jgi:putative tricarboxylic transport membrane protein
MSMKHPYQITGTVLLLLAAFIAWEALKLKFYTHLGPGPGFFSFWLALLLGVLAVLMILQATFRPSDPMPAGFFPSRTGFLKMGAILLALVATTALMDVLGFRLTMLCAFVFLLHTLGRPNWIVTLLVSVAGSFGVFYLFDRWLRVPLPTGLFGF